MGKRYLGRTQSASPDGAEPAGLRCPAAAAPHAEAPVGAVGQAVRGPGPGAFGFAERRQPLRLLSGEEDPPRPPWGTF